MHAESKASIYVKASQKYITPGAKLLNSFNSRTSVKHSDIAEMVVQLDGYHEDSLKGIHAFVEQLPVRGPPGAHRCRLMLTNNLPRPMRSS